MANYLGYAQMMGQRNPLAQGLSDLGTTLDQQYDRRRQAGIDKRQNSLADLQMQQQQQQIQQGQIQQEDMQAQRGAKQQLYGVDNPQDAYLAEMQAKQKADRADRTLKHIEKVKAYKAAGMKPEFLTEFTKAEMLQDPGMAALAPYVSFADETKMEITKDFKEGELRNPLNKAETLPAGKYKVIGTATGDPSDPYRFDKIEPVEKKAEYKFREYNSGGITVAEESQDGGKTWRKVSSAPRYKPQASGGGGSASGGGQVYSSKPMPASAVKFQQEALDAVGVASKLQADVGGFIKLIDDKKLNFGPVNNLVAKGRNFIGQSDENSANLTNFKTSIEEIRNNILMLAKGVQTDGDALRAYNTLVDNLNDPVVVRQQLVKIQENNARNEKLQKAKANTIRSEYNKDEADFSGYTNQPAAIGKGAKGTADKRPPLSAIFGKK